jgi:hypothetical protein
MKNARAAARSRFDAQHHIHDLAVLVDRSIEVGPPTGHLDVGLIDLPTITRNVPAMPGGSQ